MSFSDFSNVNTFPSSATKPKMITEKEIRDVVDSKRDTIREGNKIRNKDISGTDVYSQCRIVRQKNMWNTEDRAFDYYNKNNNNENNIALPTYSYLESITKKDEHNTWYDVTSGQIPVEGNKVPIGNTLTSYLLNNNKNSTAFIGNTTPEQMAANIFSTADNIIEKDSSQLTKTKDGKYFLIPEGENSDKLVKTPVLPSELTPGNGILNRKESDITAFAIAHDAQITVMKEEIGSIKGDEKKRVSSASTVKVDYKMDPYFKFMQAAGSIDGKEGVTKEELTQAIEAISEKKDNGLYFSNDKLEKFLKEKLGEDYNK